MQNENLCLWVLLNDKNMKIDRAIDIYFTGYAVPDNCGVFLGIFQSKQLVFQVFDAGNLGLTVTP